MTGLYILLGLLALGALWAVLAYNALVGSRNKVDESWSGVDVQLKRRHDLVPNLVETVKGYASHERATLEAVT
jgi:LemA protein